MCQLSSAAQALEDGGMLSISAHQIDQHWLIDRRLATLQRELHPMTDVISDIRRKSDPRF